MPARARVFARRAWLRLGTEAALDGSPGFGVWRRWRARAAALVVQGIETVALDYPLDARRDVAAYHRWLMAKGEPTTIPTPSEGSPSTAAAACSPSGPGSSSSTEPRFSVIVPVWRTPPGALRACVASLVTQRFADFEVRICDDGSRDPALTAYLASVAATDARFVVLTTGDNRGIAVATNHAAAGARGEFLVFVDHDDALPSTALEQFAAALDAHPLADVAYSDEDKIGESGARFGPVLKPDWSPELLLGLNYVCHLLVVRRELFDALGGLRSDFDGAQDHDFALRATEQAREVLHLPEVLYHWRILATSSAGGPDAKPDAYEAGRRAVQAALARRDEPAAVTTYARDPGRFQVRRIVEPSTSASVIVPFLDSVDRGGRFGADAAPALWSRRGALSVDFVLVDGRADASASDVSAWRSALEGAGANVQIVGAAPNEGWGRAGTLGARAATGTLLVFMTPAIVSASDDWLELLAAQALRPEVGAVGPLVASTRGRVESVGLVLGLEGVAGHPLHGAPLGRSGPLGMTLVARDCTAVSGDCFVSRRAPFEDCGGFDEQLEEGSAELDYCLRIARLGYRVLIDPTCRVVVDRPPPVPRRPPGAPAEATAPPPDATGRDDGPLRDAFFNANLRLDVPWCALDTTDVRARPASARPARSERASRIESDPPPRGGPNP